MNENHASPLHLQQNRLRSPTAETLFSGYEGVEAIGAGINADSPTPLSGDLIEWADIILVMEEVHRQRMMKKFNDLLKEKRIIVLHIPDRFDYMQPDLIEFLDSRLFGLVLVSLMPGTTVVHPDESGCYLYLPTL